MSEVKMTVRANGSIKVEGAVTVVDAEGKEFVLPSTPEKPFFSLCRCGASANKPFCDGSHNRMAFQAADTAPRKE